MKIAELRLRHWQTCQPRRGEVVRGNGVEGVLQVTVSLQACHQAQERNPYHPQACGTEEVQEAVRVCLTK